MTLDKVTVPEPIFVRAITPVPSLMVPAKMPPPPLAPVVRVTRVALLLMIEPVPASPSIVMRWPLRSSVPALLTVRVLRYDSAVSLAMDSVPPARVEAPEKVLLPESVRVPMPVLVRPRVPMPS